jgi:zinc/manganese transport system permease protein
MTPHLSLNLLSDVHQLLVYRFMVNALEAASVVAVMAAVVGWFMVLRRETFAGHTLSMMSFPGAAAAALAGLPLAAGYFAFCGAGALLIAGAAQGGGVARQAERSAVIGSVGAGSLALGYLLLSLYGGVLESLESLLFGSILGVTSGQVEMLALVAVAVLAFLAVAGRPLFFASVDGPLARASRVPVRALSVAFLLVLGLAVAATVQITGVLLVFALLVAPAASAQALTARPLASLALTVVLGLLVVWLGLGLAYFSIYPAGFFVTTVAFAIYLLARLISFARARTRGDRPPARAPAQPAGVIA